jgi:predicted Zn finger-like uncharacterized protein
VIVTCEQCETQFQLDEAKVPESGIRVRCSRCKYAFFVESPHRSDTERADDLAREALTEDSAAAGRERDSNDFGLEDGESDWQFNEEIDPAPARADGADDLAAAQEAVDDLLGSSFSESVDPDTGPDGGIDLDGSNPDGGIDLRSLDLDGSIDLGGSDLDVDHPEPLAEHDAGADPDLSSEPAEDPDGFESNHGVSSEGSAEPVQLASAEPTAVSLEASATPDAAEASDDSLMELGGLDDWALSADGVAPEPSAGEMPIGRLSRPIPEEAEKSSEVAAPMHRDAEDGPFDADPRAVCGTNWISRARGGVGWALVSLLCAYAGIVGLWPRFSASEPVLGARPMAGLEAGAIRGHWIENAAAGPIYVISGELRATSSAPLPTGSLLRIRLLDAGGAPTAAESAAVGPPVSEEQLRERNLRDLRDSQEAGALRLAWNPLAPGERRPFHAILGRVPPTAAAFEFQVVAATRPAPEPDAGADIPYLTPDLAAEAMIE